MHTTNQTLPGKAIRKALVLTLCSALLGFLASCTESSDFEPSLAAAKANSTKTFTGAERSTSLYSDASSASDATTDGFVGEVIDDSIRISWKTDSNATGYNVYRQNEYYTTVFSNEFQDTDIDAQDYTYRIIAFEQNGDETRYYTIAGGLVISVAQAVENSQLFKSSTTSGFSGEVISTGILISWRADASATGYNIYRQGQYYTTVRDTRFLDTDVKAQDYSYQITAFEESGGQTRYYPIADDLTVSYSVQPVASQSSGPTVTQEIVGESQNGTNTVNWNKDSNASGYNVYRDGEYYTTVFGTEFRDTDVSAQNHAYNIVAFEKRGTDTHFYSVASHLTVSAGTSENSANTSNAQSVYSAKVDNELSQSGTTQSKQTASSSAVSLAEAVQENVSVLSNSDGQSTNDNNPPVAAADNTVSKYFTSVTTEGFVGEVLEDSIRITWNEDPDAIGYNIYRQAEYYDTVYATEFNDTDVYDNDYYYEIQAFDNGSKEADARYYFVAIGLTVSARTLGRIDPNKPKPNDELLKDYELVFADEFNGSSLDTSKWNTSFLWGTDLIINNEEQYYVDIANDPFFGFNPFTFDGNNMTINTIKTPPKLASKSNGQPYLSGIITSYDAFKFTYGYAEVRAKMTHGRGYWPAFWLLNAYYGGADPEIDIMEFLGHNQDVAYHTFHYYDENGKLRSTKSHPTKGIDFTADFHTFSVEWAPGLIVFFVDGIETHRITDPNVPVEQMYLLANTAVGGWWAGSPDETTPFPGKYIIDYIRVYQKATLYNDAMLSDDVTAGGSNKVTSVPYADDVYGQASPTHRPTKEEWPDGYPND